MIAFNTYDIGDVVRCSAIFKTVDGLLVDPLSLIFRLRTPDGVIAITAYGVSPDVVRLTTGTFYTDIILRQEGAHYYRFEGSGIAHSAEEKHFVVRQSVFY